MSINDNSLVIPGHGTFFTAPKNTPLPAGGIKAFKNITGTDPIPWENLGHTSSENPPSLNVDGGDSTTLRTWLKENMHTVYASENWSMTGSALQADTETLGLVYNGWETTGDSGKGLIVPSKKRAQEIAIVMISSDDTGNLGFYIPNTSFAHGDAPSISIEQFFEAPFRAGFQAAATEALPADEDGTPGLFAIYGPEAFI